MATEREKEADDGCGAKAGDMTTLDPCELPSPDVSDWVESVLDDDAECCRPPLMRFFVPRDDVIDSLRLATMLLALSAVTEEVKRPVPKSPTLQRIALSTKQLSACKTARSNVSV